MKAETRECLIKADRDFETAEREFAVTTVANYDAVCFHCQQSAEKRLKGILVEHGLPFQKTHDLTSLLDHIMGSYPELEEIRPALARLTDYSVGYRYPGMDADIVDILRR